MTFALSARCGVYPSQLLLERDEGVHLELATGMDRVDRPLGRTTTWPTGRPARRSRGQHPVGPRPPHRRQLVAGGGHRPDFRLYYYFLDSIGRKARNVAAVVFRLVLKHVVQGDRLLLAVDDTPTARFGPGWAGCLAIRRRDRPVASSSTVLSGSCWPASCVMPVAARWLYHSWPRLGVPPGRAHAAGVSAWRFQTKLPQAADLITWARPLAAAAGKTLEVVVDGGSAQKEVLRPAQAAGVVLIGRLPRMPRCTTCRPSSRRSDAARGVRVSLAAAVSVWPSVPVRRVAGNWFRW